MIRAAWLLGFAIVVWAGSFGVSVGVTEWRRPDVSSDDLARLREALAALQSQLPAPPHETPTTTGPSPTGTPTPMPTGGAVLLTPGAEATSGGATITVEGIETGSWGGMHTRVIFILEGPHPGAIGQDFKVVDEDNFVCEAGVNADSGAPLAEAEKTRFWIVFECQDGRQPKTLMIDSVAFTFPT